MFTLYYTALAQVFIVDVLDCVVKILLTRMHFTNIVVTELGRRQMIRRWYDTKAC